MPYTVEVPGHGVVEVPDGVSLQQAQIEIEKAFPYTGEDIAGAMQDPSFTPTKSDYLKFEEYSKTKQVDWINTAAQAADAAIGMIGGAVSEGAQGAAANPLNYIEGFAQGTRQLYGLAAQSQDPSSPLFKFKDLVAGTGTPESRYNQFLEARDFANTTARLERGEEGVWVPPEYTNPEYVQGVSMILDPTLFVPGVGEILGTGKLATRAVGKGAQLTGRAVAGVARPLERFAGAAERIAAETIGTTPEALRNVASTAGIAGALGIAPEAAAFAAIPAGIRTAREAGEALSRAGENLMNQPSRIGPLEAIGAAPGANLRQRMLGVIGQYGGDAAVDASLRGLAGGIEGAALGTLLGGLSGGEEGAAAGLGSGGVQGVAGALGGRAYQKLTGEAAKEARAGDLGRFIDGQQDPTTKALFERLRDTHGVDAASGLMDLQGLVRGKLGDVEVEYLSNEDFTKRYKISARGVQVDDKGGRPAVVINADIIGKGTGDGPLYTLGHELFHALEKSTQLQGGATEIKNALVGRWIQEGDTIRKLSEGAFSDADIEARFNQYRDKLGAGNASMADELAQYDTINKKADYVASELAAEHFAGLLAGQKPDALLKGFTGLTRQLVDLALTQNASRALAEAAATIERTFGVKPTDSVLFPDLKQASPQVNAMLRDLLRARRKLDEKINIQDDKTKAVLKPEDVANPLAAKQLIELGLAEQMPDGTVRAMSTDEIVAREKKDQDSLNAIIENTPGNSRMVDGVALGRLSPNQLSAIEQSQTVSSRMKDKIRAINATMDAGTSLNITYSAALKKIVNRLTGKKVNRYSSGIRLSDRDMLPYSFYFSKAANPVVKAIDISKVRDAILKDTASNGSVGKGLWDNVDGFMGDLAKYFTNLDQKEGARRSAEIFGLEKAKYLGDFVGAAEKGESKFIRDFRLDRIGSMAPSGFRARFSEEAYQLSKQRWMPAEKLGDKSITNSEEGYRIISGAKHKLYGTDGKLIGIYDTQTQAERKADATQERLQPEVRQQQRPLGDEGRQATEAGGRNRIERGQEGQGQGGAVRQAGDVITPESPEVAKKVASGDTSNLKDGELLGTFRFMPPDLIDKLAVTEEQRQAMRGKSGFAFVSDWADAGRPYVTQLGRNIDVLMGGMGYPFLPEISGKGAWAGTFSGMTDTVMKKIKATDGIGLVVLGGPESSASSRAFSRAFGEELADSISQNPKLKEKLDKIARKARKQWIEYRRGEGRSINVPEINSLEDWARFTQLERSGEQPESGLTFNDRDFLVRTIGSHDNKKALGIRSWKDVLRNYNLQNKDFTPGQVVAVVQFSGAKPVRAETIGAKPHPSYEALIPGKAIGTLPQKTMIKDVFRDFLSKTQPPAFTRKVQTNMPKFVVGEGDMRFMPSDTDYLSAVKQGDTKAAQQMVDEAAKAAGYTIGPVYHGTPTGGFNVFDKRMRGETSGVARQAFSFTTDKKAAEGYSKRLGDEAVRLDAGLRVANDAMRMFDEDIAAQEYFSSKGYSSVDDGMLPEFDWGSIDDVPEFIKELRGYAKDLKPINKKLSDNFVEAAKVMTTTKAVPEVKRVFLRIPENAPVFQATPATLGQVMSGFSAEKQPTKAGIVELPGGDRIYYVADSSQVKLADPVTKDLDGNVIPLSQRFKATSEDIRYMPAGEAGQGAPKRYESVDSFREHWNSLGVRNMTNIRGKGTPYEHIRPSEIQVEKANRNKGLGTAFMQDLTEFADSQGIQIRLNPSDELGATSKGRLEKFYKRFGFVENKPGKNKDYAISERFYRQPSLGKRFMPASSTDIYRAGDKSETGVKAFSSWSENKSTAEAYLDNPGFGGSVLRSEKVPLNRVLDADTTNRKGMERLARQLGFDEGTGDEWFDNGWKYPWEESRSVKEALKRSGFDAIRYPDDFPEGATSIVPLKDFGGSGNNSFMPAAIQREVGRNVDFANPPTAEKAVDALSSEKKSFWRKHDELPEGSPVGVRIDIPAFLNRGTYVQTIHESATPGDVGDRIGYDTSVRLSGPVKFFVKQGSSESSRGAVAIKEGRAKKHPIATVEGNLIKDRSVPPDIEDWTPVGMDPKKHSYFYDKRTGQPVKGGSESYSVGNTVFVKDPVPGDIKEFRYMPSPDSAMPGAYSFPGGYRALPGKAKGSLRLYGPAGSLIGIASSLDEAQRILRRKGNR